MKAIDDDAIRAELKAACAADGSQRAWAEKHGLSDSYVSDVLSGRRWPGKSVLDALGYEHAGYRRKRGSPSLAGKDPFAGVKFEDV